MLASLNHMPSQSRSELRGRDSRNLISAYSPEPARNSISRRRQNVAVAFSKQTAETADRTATAAAAAAHGVAAARGRVEISSHRR